MSRPLARPSEQAVIPPSLRANFLTAALPSALLAGLALGWLMPVVTWRAGTPTPLGDFSLAAGVGIVVWQVLSGAPSRRQVGNLALLTGSLFLLRELLWRLPSAQPLSLLYGVGWAVLLVLSLGIAGLELRWHASRGKRLVPGEEPLTFETLLRLLVGTLAVLWLAYGFLRA